MRCALPIAVAAARGQVLEDQHLQGSGQQLVSVLRGAP